MNRELSKQQRYISIFSLMLLAVLAIGAPAAGWIWRSHAPETEASQEGEPVQEQVGSVIQRMEAKIEKQKAVDEMLREELDSGSYTFEAPLVVLDPYGESPLTALILFETEELSQIEIVIPGEDEDTGAVHMFDVVSTQHTIPVYGLYPGERNEVTIRQLTENGETVAENVVEVETEPLPEWLDDYIILTECYDGDYENGLNFIYHPAKFAFDKNGNTRWFLSDKANQLQVAVPAQEKGRWFVAYGSYYEGDTVIFEVDLLGKVYQALYTPYGIHHDLALMPNGNLLVTSSQGETVEDFIVEISAETGEIVNTLDLKTVLQRTRFNASRDWLHNNSIVWDEQDHSIIISSNVQCTVAKLTWPEGSVKWLLSSPKEYMPRLERFLLQPVGEEFEYSYNQHNVSILPDYDGNPDTTDILLFDNGSTRFARDKELQRAIAANEIAVPENYSRLVHYRIDEKNMTVEQVWQYGKERGSELYALWRGSAQLLPNENILGYFDKQNAPAETDAAVSGNMVEVDLDGNLVWDAELFSKGKRGNLVGYRAFRYPIYSSDNPEQDIYSEAQNLIPREVLDINT